MYCSYDGTEIDPVDCLRPGVRVAAAAGQLTLRHNDRELSLAPHAGLAAAVEGLAGGEDALSCPMPSPGRLRP